VRGILAILGTLVVLANLACAALCGVLPVESTEHVPPCHQQKEAVKACNVQDWADNAAKIVVEQPVAHTIVLLAPVERLVVATQVRVVALAQPPPIPLRI
jgi:hypothetical protein